MLAGQCCDGRPCALARVGACGLGAFPNPGLRTHVLFAPATSGLPPLARSRDSGTEAIGIIELHRRIARGYRNPDNYRLL